MEATNAEPLLKWPHGGTLWQETMAAIWNDHRVRPIEKTASGEFYDWAYEGGEPPMTQEEARRLAPALDEAIRKTAAEYEPSEFLLRILNYELNAVVREIAGRIPDDQREKLADAMKAATRAASGR